MEIRKRIGWSLVSLLAISAVTAQAQVKPFTDKAQYMVIDLSGGPDAAKYPVSYTTEKPDLDFDTCRTKELWLRLIPAGTFMMGSPEDEIGRGAGENLRKVRLTKPFYIGVFQVTQNQYELVMGTNPTAKHKGNTRPVTNASYDMIRGTSAGARWPANGSVDATSFFGKLREKTGVLADLPTDAQWEYACRAGTTTALNTGKNLTNRDYCPNMAEAGRYLHNVRAGVGGYTEGPTKVGMYPPNAWGLYDMHGNAYEHCLDWHTNNVGTDSVTDPKGPPSGIRRVERGGFAFSHHMRSAARVTWSEPDKAGDADSFRIVVLPGPGQVNPVTPGLLQPIRSPVTPQPAEEPTEAVTLGDAEEKLAATCAEFKAVWDEYKVNAEKINAEFQPRADTLQQQYLKALETLKTTVQGRGDLDKAKAVATEIERFTEMKTLPPAPDDKAIAEIKALQANAIRPFASLERDRLARMNTLTQRYGQALERLQTELVKAGKLDDATAVREARERARRALTPPTQGSPRR